MIDREMLKPEDLEPLLPEIGQQAVDVAAVILAAEAQVLELRETLPVWEVEARLEGNDLANEAHFTERWHHQIRVNEQPRLAAVTSRSAEADDLYLDEVCGGPYVDNLQTALGFLAGHREIRVLHLPYYGLQALWAIDGNPEVAVFGQIGVAVPSGAISEAQFVVAVSVAPAVQGFSACP